MSQLDEQIKNRRDKRAALAEAGVTVYPYDFDFDLEPSGVVARFGDNSAEELEEASETLRVPGRIRAIRGHGKLVFADLSDGAEKVQLFIRTNRLPEGANLVLENLDLGDYVGTRGRVIRTRKGELSIEVEDLVLLAKAVRPLPEKWHGLTDVEARYRQRYLDLVVNPESRRVFEARAALFRGIPQVPRRAWLPRGRDPDDAGDPGRRDGAAVQDPPQRPRPRSLPPGGARALLEAPPGRGDHRVYEINRNFRNEGISTSTTPSSRCSSSTGRSPTTTT